MASLTLRCPTAHQVRLGRSQGPRKGPAQAQAALRGLQRRCAEEQAPGVHDLYSNTSPQAIWTRPTPDRDETWIKPSYLPKPLEEPMFTPRREDQPLYAPAPEFKPAELPEQGTELPEGPKMPERRPDPIPAGNPKKERPPGSDEDVKREEPPAKPKEAPKQ